MTPQELKEFLAKHDQEHGPQENALDKWRREVREREAEHAHERAQSRERRRVDTAPVDVAAEIKAALEVEREFTTQVLAGVVAELQRTASDDLERATRALTVELGELRATLAELRAAVAIERVERTGKATEPIDLPSPLSARRVN
jgi:flagellar motor switch/type III secretory pathway protein FliN